MKKETFKSFKYVKTLPKNHTQIYNGGLYRQWVKCGKKNCKCARGERHEAYYFFTREFGKLTKTYVRKTEREAFVEILNEAIFWRRFRMPKYRPQMLLEFRKQLEEYAKKSGNMNFGFGYLNLAERLKKFMEEDD